MRLPRSFSPEGSEIDDSNASMQGNCLQYYCDCCLFPPQSAWQSCCESPSPPQNHKFLWRSLAAPRFRQNRPCVHAHAHARVCGRTLSIPPPRRRPLILQSLSDASPSYVGTDELPSGRLRFAFLKGNKRTYVVSLLYASRGANQ